MTADTAEQHGRKAAEHGAKSPSQKRWRLDYSMSPTLALCPFQQHLCELGYRKIKPKLLDIAANSLVPEKQNGFALDFFFYPLSLASSKCPLCLHWHSQQVRKRCRNNTQWLTCCLPCYEQWHRLCLPALVYDTYRTLEVWELCPSGQESALWVAEGRKGMTLGRVQATQLCDQIGVRSPVTDAFCLQF